VAQNWWEINLRNWESRVPIHLGADGYDLASFDDASHISDVVRFDRERLGPLDGLDVVHLQCHIGTDTVSLARLGARSVTGLDFSPSALEAAAELSRRAGAVVTWERAGVFAAPERLGEERFDLVYTGIGSLCWLPSVQRWADAVARLLRPGGRLFMREGHPVLWSLSDPRDDGLLVVEYPYFETSDGTAFHEEISYAGTGPLAEPATVQFNHGLGEIVTSLLDVGLTITALEEHRSVPWNPLGDLCMPSPDLPGEYVLRDGVDRLPMTYTLQAIKPPRVRP
jgi:SAM-dependent methyltransferase